MARDDDTVYEMDRILSAEKLQGSYRLWIKWKDHADATPEWKTDIVKQTSHPGLLQEIQEQDAVQRCRDQLNEGRDGEDDPVVRDEHNIEESYHHEIPDESDADDEPGDTPTADAPDPTDDAISPGASTLDGPTIASRRPRRPASRNVPGVPAH